MGLKFTRGQRAYALGCDLAGNVTREPITVLRPRHDVLFHATGLPQPDWYEIRFETGTPGRAVMHASGICAGNLPQAA